MRLHQQSMFHPRYIKNDLPANFWARKLSSKDQAYKDKQQEILDRINKLDVDDIDDGLDGMPLVEDFKKTLLDQNKATGLSDKGIELAVLFYQKQQESLPPRMIAHHNQHQLKMPIAFKDMAASRQPLSKSVCA